MFAVELIDVSKSFGSIRALDGLTLRLSPGTLYGVLGPNGAGKTTMIRAVAGLVAPDSGSALVLGRPAGHPEALRRLGYMPQAAALYEELTVRENVRFFAACYGNRDPAAVESAVELVGLTSRADSQVRTLSGGLRQRASLACAVAHSPEVLLLDEPTVGVDPTLRAQFWEHFRSMASKGTTMLISSHVMDEAERCDKLGLVLNGRLLAEGSPAEIRESAGASTLEEAFLKLDRTGRVAE